MPMVVLIVGVGLLAAAVAAVITAAALLRRGWDELDDVFHEARGDTPEMGPPPWSSVDLAALRDGVAAVDPHDPFAALIRSSAPVSWHAAGPDGSGTNGSVPRAVTEPRQITWRAPAAAAS